MRRAATILAVAVLLAVPASAKGGGGPMFRPSRVELFAPRFPGANYIGFVHLTGLAGSPRQGKAELTLTDSTGAALATGSHDFALNFNHPSKEIVFPVEGVNLRGGCAPSLDATVDLQLSAGGRVERHRVPLQLQPGPATGQTGTCPP